MSNFSILDKFKIIKNLKKNYVDEFVHLGKKNGDFYSLNFFIKRIHVFGNAEFVKFVFNKNKDSFEKSKGYKELEPIFGDGLLTTDDHTAKLRRQVMGGLFSKTNTFKLEEKIKSNILSLSGRKKLRGERVDVYNHFSILTLQQISLLLFNLKISDKDCTEFIHKTGVLQSWIVKKVMSPFKFLFRLPTTENKMAQQFIKYLDNFVSKLTKDKETDLPLLKRLQEGYINDQKLDSILRDEAITYLIAGSETTSTLLSACIFELARNKNYYELVKKEAHEYLKNKILFSELVYIKAVLNETLRLYNPAPQISRRVVEPLSWNGVQLNVGDEVRLIIDILHKNPKYWKQPERFFPERFIDEKVQPYSFLPFGTAGRSCIGKNLSLVISSLFLADFVTKYEIKKTDNFKLKFIPSITLRAKGGVLVDIY